MKPEIYIGTAGWSIPPQLAKRFPGTGTHLERYSRIFNAVEINSSFYLDHQIKTYQRWADSVPPDFRFSVKLSRYFTQEMRLKDTGAKLIETLDAIKGLGRKWGVLLIQLPPSLGFNARDAEKFFSKIRQLYKGAIAIEPRHMSWANPKALKLYKELKIEKVSADPERCPSTFESKSLAYLRLHGSPVIYKSNYGSKALAKYASELKDASAKKRWCIFDNTTFGFATENALQLTRMHNEKVRTTF
jgi:uncharacterized protein YecE (DUF72 family)